MKKLICLFFILCSISCFSQDASIDSLFQVLNKLKEDTNMVKTLDELSWEFYQLGEYEKCILYANKAKTSSEKINYNKGISSAYTMIGHALYNQGNYPGAIENHFAALKLKEQAGDKKAVSNSYNNIGNIYDSQGKYAEALKYYKKALQLQLELNDTLLIARSYHNIGLVYLNQNKNDLAIKQFFLTLDLMKIIKDEHIIASCYDHLGIVYAYKGENETALKYALLALSIREKSGNKALLAKSYVNLGARYKSLKMDSEAKKYSLKGVELGKEMGYVELLSSAYQTLSMVYANEHQYEKALQYYEKYSDARDSLINEENNEKILRSEMNYEFEKRETAIKAGHDQQVAIAAAVSKKQQIIIWAVCGLFILATIIFLLIFRQNKFRAEQRTMQLEQKLLRSQMNPHFIFNSLTAIESFIYKSEPREAGRYLSGFARLMRLILDNSREEFVTLEAEIQTLEHYLKLQKLRFDDFFDYSIRTSDAIDVYSIQIPPMLAQPFIENAIEHGLKGIDKKGKIEIDFSLRNNELVFEVRDNGIGIEKTLALKNENKTHKSLATTITSERLKNLNKKKKNIQVSMKDLRNTENEVTGTLVTFLIPFTRI